MKHLYSFALGIAVFLSVFPPTVSGQTFTGSNAPGGYTDFTISTTTNMNNLTITVPGNSTSFSHLRIKQGIAPTDTDFLLIAPANGKTNVLFIEQPELPYPPIPTNYILRVTTPTNSLAHAFSVIVETNQSGFRSTNKPPCKPLESVSLTPIGLTRGNWHYYRFEVTTNITGWRVGITETLENYTVDLYVQRNALPTEASSIKRSVNQTNDFLTFTSGDMVPGTYYVGLAVPDKPGDAYFLETKIISFPSLTWDPGTADAGTMGYTNLTGAAGDYYFKITTQSASAWRSALKVHAGNANLYLNKSAPPTLATNMFKSERDGSDGFILTSAQFAANQEWYYLVRASEGAQWTLVSGVPYVTDLGNLAADGSSGSGNIAIGPEGTRFFKTVVTSNTVAWRLWLNGSTNTILQKKAVFPTPDDIAPSKLLVPGQFDSQLYFIGVPGAPDTIINLDSRQQLITDIPFGGAASGALDGFNYATYRVQVPPNQIVWQINLHPLEGNPNIAARRTDVANELYNDGYSEIPTLVPDSLTLVPTNLSDGTYYLTVYSSNSCSYTLTNSVPAITDISYETVIVNDETNRTGWRYYRVADIGSQVGRLGWEVSITNYTPGTQIALRRNAAPSIWNKRASGSSSTTISWYDVITTNAFLQRPDQQADVWYIGVYNLSNILGDFTLITREITPALLNDGTQELVVQDCTIPPGRLTYFKMIIPSDIRGWDLRLTNVTQGTPQMCVRREALPATMETTLPSPDTATNWPNLKQWAPDTDWTGRSLPYAGTNAEDGRILAMGMRRPLEPATYYIGITNLGSSNAVFTMVSRWIGSTNIPIVPLEYNGGVVTNLALAPREAAYYEVVIPPSAPSWKLRLTPLATNMEVMMVVSTNGIPNIESEKKMQKTGKEHFVLLPGDGQTNLVAYLKPGTNYIVVVSEGSNAPPVLTRIGTNDVQYVLESLGPMPEVFMGTLFTEDLMVEDTLEGGEVKAYHYANTVGTLGIEILITNLSFGGKAVLVYNGGLLLPDPGAYGNFASADPYGYLEGETVLQQAVTPFLLTVGNPFLNGTIMVKARSVNGTNYPNASYRLTIRKIVPEPIGSFGIDTPPCTPSPAVVVPVVNQNPLTWKFFEIIIPTNTGALGWDLRITNVLSGTPKMTLCKGQLGIKFVTENVSPNAGTNWPEGGNWYADKDWTGRSLSFSNINEDGRILAMGKGRPLDPGTYYIGVHDAYDTNNVTPLNYTLVSSPIGPCEAIPVYEMAFAEKMTQTNGLPVRMADYYHVYVPSNIPSWKLKLSGALTNDGLMMVVCKGALPNVSVGGGTLYSATNIASAGRRLQKIGDEYFLMLPGPGATNIGAGDYYVAVISEGQGNASLTKVGTNKCAYTLRSMGAAPITDLGMLTTSYLVTNGVLSGGDTEIYQFQVPDTASKIEADCINRSNNPVMVLISGAAIPDPGMSGVGANADPYGHEGGQTVGAVVSTNSIGYVNPLPGIYTLVVKARSTNTTSFPNASYTLRLRIVEEAMPIEADSLTVVTNHAISSWKYFAVTSIPTNAMGWDIRLANVQAGVPKMVVRRQQWPSTLNTAPWSAPGQAYSWPISNQWAAAGDWTSRSLDAHGIVNEDYRLLAMGMRRPLEPGTNYIIGVFNSGTNPAVYSIWSRLIGTNQTIPVLDLPLLGSVTNYGLAPREAAYYRLVVPSNTPSLRLRLSSLGGEVMLLGLKNALPNVGMAKLASTLGVNGKCMQKEGDEFFTQLPAAGQTWVPAGTNYFAVVSEGVNPLDKSSVGEDPSSYILSSLGPMPVTDIGQVSTSDLLIYDTVEGGNMKAYQFGAPPGNLGYVATLESRVGNPVMALRAGSQLVDPDEEYGLEGGYSGAVTNGLRITVPNPAISTYTLMIKAQMLGSLYQNAEYLLRIREIRAEELNLHSGFNTNGLVHTVSGQLEDNQRIYYQVQIPSNNFAAVLGWKLELDQTSGQASMRASKGALPSDAISTNMAFVNATAILVPPYLSPGTWYVEVKGVGATAFTLTSKLLELERPPWNMPSPGSSNVAPGLTYPDFGDSSVDTNGNLLPNAFLQQGYYHYYAVNVPDDNAGVMRLQLQAVSGNPDLYARVAYPPTLQHTTNGANGTAFERSMTAVATEYANWVPLDGRFENRLKPGLWYFAVKASSANANYRLVLSVSDVLDIPVHGTMLSNITLAGGNWRYFRAQVPTSVLFSWSVAFGQNSGDVDMFVRDTVPPGNGTSGSDYRDWVDDNKNNGPYNQYNAPNVTNTFVTPPLRPGRTYYLGFRANSDASFNLTTFTNATSMIEPGTVAFYGGSTNRTLAPASGFLFRVDAPADATRWIHSSTHPSNIVCYLEQGTLPLTNNADWKSAGVNGTNNQFFATWPWVAGQSYFIAVTNVGITNTPFNFVMDGKNCQTDDSDNDLMPDCWERQYYGSLGLNATGDNDGDGILNLQEYYEGSNPSDRASYRPRLTTVITNGLGFILRSPNIQTNFPMGSVVTLTAVPSNGYAFVSWSGAVSSYVNPVALVMDTNRTVIASIKPRCDDFIIRETLVGSSVDVTNSNVGTSKEAGEPNHAGNTGGRSLWWTWTAPGFPGSVTLTTAGSSINTLLAVYTGSAVNALTLVASNDNVAPTNLTSSVTFAYTPNQVYQIAVDGSGGQSAPNVQLHLRNSVQPPQAINFQRLPDGRFQFGLSGNTNRVFQIDYTTNLVNWIVIELITNTTGQYLFLDTNAPGAPIRFYRTSLLP